MEGVSICITAYDACDYIKESLDSVISQTWFKTHDNWEIIVGVDGCEKTLEYLKTIMHNYKNLKVWMMDSNQGTYVTSNTIMVNSTYDNLFRFDADDIMFPDLVETVMNQNSDCSFMRYGYINEELKGIHKGAIYIKKPVFLKYGGFKPWICSGDIELYYRLKNIERYKELDDVLCYYRRNENSLTRSEETGIHSELRKNYHKQIKSNITNPEEAIIECVTNTYKEIFPIQNGVDIDVYKDNEETLGKLKEVISNSGVSVCMTVSYSGYKDIEKCIQSILKQDWFTNYILKCEIIIGVDNDEVVAEDIKNRLFGNDKVRILNMNSPCGKSVTLNTIVSDAIYENVIIFDTNHLMSHNLVETIMITKDDSVLVRPKSNTYYIDFNPYKSGHIYVKKSVFLKYGGFNPSSSSPENTFYDRIKDIENVKDISDVLMTKLQPEKETVDDIQSSPTIDFVTNTYERISLKPSNMNVDIF